MGEEKRYWRDYQKDIPDGPFFYVRSCIRQTFTPGAETMLLKILTDYLGLDVYEDPRHTCCSGIGYHTDVVPLETTMTIIARQLSLMQEDGYENLLVSCVTSFGLYNEVLDIWHHFPESSSRRAATCARPPAATLRCPRPSSTPPTSSTSTAAAWPA